MELSDRNNDERHIVENDANVESGEGNDRTSTAALPAIPQRLLKLKLLSAGFSFFAAGANDGCIGALIPYILKSYEIGTGSIALLYLCTFLGWLLAAIINTHISHVLRLGALLVLGAGMQLLSQALRAWVAPFPLFTFTFFLTGLGQAFQDSHSNTFVSGVGGAAHRWLGFIHASYGLGLLVSPFMATAIATTKGGGEGSGKWALFFIVLAGVGCLNLGLVLAAFWESMGVIRRSELSEGESIPAGRSGAAWKEMKQIVVMKNVWIVSLFYFFHLGVATTAGGWIVEYLVRVRHGNLREMGYVPSGFYGGLFLSRVLLAEPTYRFGPRRMLITYSVLCFAIQLVLWLIPNLVSTIAMFSLMGFLLGPFFAAGMSVASKLFPSQIQPAALGLIFVTAQAGAAIFPSLIGLVAARAGVQVLPPILAGLVVVMGVMWAFVPKIPVDTHRE